MTGADDIGGMSAWDVILHLLGVSPTAGPLAYWRSHEIHEAVRSLREQLGRLVGEDFERWWPPADDQGREELVGQAHLPSLDIVRRPWSTGEAYRARVPYVPLAAILHAMAAGGHRTVAHVAHAHAFNESTTPWTLLEVLDSAIEGEPYPGDLTEVAAGLRLAMNQQPDDDDTALNPARWILQRYQAATWDDLAAIAASAAAEEGKRQAEIRTGKAAKKPAATV